MKKLTIILFALLLVAGVAIITDTGSVFAQDDDETTTEPEFDPLTDNWCTNPDRWGDGRCNVEGDIWLTNWYYICGYYMARIASGEYSMGPTEQLIDNCLVDIPPVPAPVITVGHHAPGCVRAFGTFIDFMGGISIPAASSPAYADAACTQFIANWNFNFVWASSPANAQSLCQSIFGENQIGQDGNVFACS